MVKDRRVELRAVTVGVTNRGFAEARTGLAAGEIVIARAAAFLRNGDEVRFGVRVSTPWISAGAEWPFRCLFWRRRCGERRCYGRFL